MAVHSCRVLGRVKLRAKNEDHRIHHDQWPESVLTAHRATLPCLGYVTGTNLGFSGEQPAKGRSGTCEFIPASLVLRRVTRIVASRLLRGYFTRDA